MIPWWTIGVTFMILLLQLTTMLNGLHISSIRPVKASPLLPITMDCSFPKLSWLLNHTSIRTYSTLWQDHLKGPHKKFRPPRKPLDGKPMMRGVILKTLIKKPKKPNSANRKCVLVRLTNGKEAVAYVPGIGHNLQVISTVCHFIVEIGVSQWQLVLKPYLFLGTQRSTRSLWSSTGCSRSQVKMYSRKIWFTPCN